MGANTLTADQYATLRTTAERAATESTFDQRVEGLNRLAARIMAAEAAGRSAEAAALVAVYDAGVQAHDLLTRREREGFTGSALWNDIPYRPEPNPNRAASIAEFESGLWIRPVFALVVALAAAGLFVGIWQRHGMATAFVVLGVMLATAFYLNRNTR